MASARAILQQMTNQMLYVVLFVLLFIGTFGYLGNLMTFS
jgi:hypothetical protein